MTGTGSGFLVTAAAFSVFLGCNQLISAESATVAGNANQETAALQTEPVAPLNREGQTLEARFPAPTGFARVAAPENSFTAYLRTLPLKPHGTQVMLHSGQPKNRQDVHAAVIDLEIGKKDLQQCADAVMRLRAEYLFQAKREMEIHFNFTSGDRADFSQYAKGYRPVFTGNTVSWQLIGAPNNSYSAFRKYMDLVFTYAGTASLEKELQPVSSLSEVKPGDVFIQGGHPGHAVIVLDVAENKETNQKLMLLAQSYMPAQDIHVLVNPAFKVSSPWYVISDHTQVITPEWAFTAAHLKRFPY